VNQAAFVSIRVDTAPLALRPLLSLYGYAFGYALFAYYAVQRITLTIEFVGTDNLAPDRNYIFCHWHGVVPLALQCSVPHLPSPLIGRAHVWMQHPLWYMKPIHVLLGLIGVRRIVLGSTGHHGRRAADELAGLLRAGYSTVVLPDGPAGPRQTLKRGVLHLASESGVPIVPLQLGASCSITVPTWDRKELPTPFSTIRLRIGQPIAVAGDEFDHAAQLLVLALGGDAPDSKAT
jgi:lysophospholipid acyltransferase (LPLAT)-like uncharacterized protein